MTPDSAQDDLAFLKALVQAGDDGRRRMGEAYLAGGVCYGVQMLGHGGQVLGWLPSDGPVGLAIAAGPTVVFLALITWISIRNRRAARQDAASRAVAAVFAAIGTANLALIALIGAAAFRERSIEIWQLYPCLIMIGQGAAWLAAWIVKRQAFAAMLAAGWFVTGVAGGFAIGHLGAFIAIIGIGLWLFMALPGYLMMRDAKAG